MSEISLSQAEVGKKYIVKAIRDEERLVSRLSSMGILTMSELEICQNHNKQPVLVFVRDTLVAIGREESKKITIGGVCE